MSSLLNEGSAEMWRVFKAPLFQTHNPDVYSALGTWSVNHNYSHLSDCCFWAQQHIDESEADFNRMCIGPYRLTVPPYESVWRSHTRVLNNRYSAAVAFSYAELGLSVSSFREMPDFVGNEFEFMYCLAELHNQHLKANNNEECSQLEDMYLRFWTEHLGHWVYEFLSGVQQDATSEFWREWARVLGEQLGSNFLDVSLSNLMTGMEQPLTFVPPSKDLS